MTFYASTLGQLLLTQMFVFYIWFVVLFKTLKSHKDLEGDWLKVAATSLGLVVTSTAICGIIATRAYELYNVVELPLFIIFFYIILIIGGFVTMLAASIGTSYKQLKFFIAVTLLWATFYTYSIVTN